MRALVLALGLLALPAAAQPAADAADGEAAVRAAIAQLFDGMRAKDTTAIRAVMHPSVRLMTTMTREGVDAVDEAPMADFLRAVAGAPVLLDERLGEVEVRVDDGLASAWMPYRFYAGERFSHCGVNAMQLARTPAGWQIVHIMDTRRRDCGASDD